MMQRDKLIQQLKEILMRHDEIVFAYLFGSYATGHTHKFSDVDIAVYLKKYDVKTYRKIFDDLAFNLPAEIDLVVLNKVPPLFGHKILKEGILLFSRDEDTRIKYVENTLILALDFKEVYNQLIKAKGDMLNAGK